MQNKSVFCYLPNERFKVDRRYGWAIDSAEECLQLNSFEEEILIKIAQSKYLEFHQIQDYEKTLGRNIEDAVLDEILLGMEIRRILTRYKMFIPNTEDTLVFYGLDFWGMIKARQDLGIQLHKGICWYPKKDRVQRGLPQETCSDVKRILMGNQILLALSKARVPMQASGVMETFRSLSDEAHPPLVRSTINVKIDETSILAFEVVRTYSTSYLEAVSKMDRYYKLLNDKKYLSKNYHNHKAFPQIVFVVENEEHAKRLKRFFQERGVWNLDDVTVLFSEDELIQNNIKRSIYELNDEDQKIWYELPTIQGLEVKYA